MSERVYLSDREVKSELLEILNGVDLFLKEKEIQYTIFSGTLLGALRHKGFIPWDDDIDIAMRRSEYERLLEILRIENYLGENLHAEGFELGNSDLPFLKIVNSKIKCMEKVTDHCYVEENLWIDIFPIDGVPEQDREKYFRKLDNIIDIYQLRRISQNGWEMGDAGGTGNTSVDLIESNTKTEKETKRSFFEKVYRKYLYSVSFDRLCSIMINTGKKYSREKTSLLTNTLWGIGFKEAFPAEFMLDMTEYEFENRRFPGISNADGWLRIRYGDYMQLPPEEKRESHGLKAWRI